MKAKPKTTATKEEAKPALVPKLRFPEFRGEEGWNAEALGVVAEFVNEKIPLGRVTVESYVSTENILPDYGGVATASKLPTTGSVTRYRPNDTLVSNIRPYLKKVWVADKEGGASNDVIVIRAKPKLRPEYLASLLKNDAFIDYVMTGAKGVKMPRGDIGSMKAYPALYPRPAEQQKIAECLSSVDEVIAAQARKLDALKTHKKGLMQQLFPREGETQPRLRFPEFQGDWVLHSGAHITSKITKGSSPTWQGFSYQAHGVLFITSENVRDGFLDVSEPKFLPEEFFAKQSNSHLLHGDILINIVGASIGRNCIYRLQLPAFTNQAVALFRVTKEHSYEFVSYCYQHDQLQQAVSASQSDSARPNLSLTDLRNMKFLLPSLPEQHRIATCLTSLDALIAAETQKHAALQRHKRGLMQQLFPSPEEVAA